MRFTLIYKRTYIDGENMRIRLKETSHTGYDRCSQWILLPPDNKSHVCNLHLIYYMTKCLHHLYPIILCNIHYQNSFQTRQRSHVGKRPNSLHLQIQCWAHIFLYSNIMIHRYYMCWYSKLFKFSSGKSWVIKILGFVCTFLYLNIADLPNLDMFSRILTYFDQILNPLYYFKLILMNLDICWSIVNKYVQLWHI